MGLIIGLIASILCAVIYMNMCKREQPLPMEKKRRFFRLYSVLRRLFWRQWQ